MPGSGSSGGGIDGLLNQVANAGTSVTHATDGAHTQVANTGDRAHAAGEQVTSTLDSAQHAVDSAQAGVQSTQTAYHQRTGHDSSVIAAAGTVVAAGGSVVAGARRVAAPVVRFADEVQADAGDVNHVVDAAHQVGADVSTTAQDGQTTVGDVRTTDSDVVTTGHDTRAAEGAVGNVFHHFSIANVLAARDAVEKVVADGKKVVADVKKVIADAKTLEGDGKKIVTDVKDVYGQAKTAVHNIVERHTGGTPAASTATAPPTSTATTSPTAPVTPAAAEAHTLVDPNAVSADAFIAHFHSSLFDEAHPPLVEGDLLITEAHGAMAISKPYAIEIVFSRRTPEFLEFETIDALLAGTAEIGFGPHREHKVQGVLHSIEALREEPNTAGQYKAVLVPRIAYLEHVVESTVYQDKNAVDILVEVLRHHGLSRENEDYEIRIAEWRDKPSFYRKYPKREYVVQYKESELAFVSRLLEHDGIFYFFEEGPHGEKLVVGDANSAFHEIASHEQGMAFRAGAGATVTDEHVTALKRRKEIVPRKVHLRDFNYRTPAANLYAATPVDDQLGHGEVFLYGDHAKNLGEARRLSRVRAEELRIRKQQFTGSSVVRALRPGTTFTLHGHSNAAMDLSYIVTSVVVSVQQSEDGAARTTPAAGSGHPAGPFSNDFEAVTLDTTMPFRPARATPRPQIAGVIHARIDQVAGAADDLPAPIDEQGRYRVLLPFNNEDGGTGRASRWIRLAEPYTGMQYGMHFPLHVGTEVLIVHLDGDPDRPVIMGSVPNYETGSVVTNEDATRSRIVTRSNIRMVWRDRTRSEAASGGGTPE